MMKTYLPCAKKRRKIKKPENPKSRLPETRSHDFGKTDPNKTNINNTKYNDTDNQSIYQPINPSISLEQSTSCIPQHNDAYEIYRQIIKDNIYYEQVFQNDRYSKEDVDEIIELMLETICSTKKHLRINSENIPVEIVKARFLKLNYSYIEYVLDTLSTNTTRVYNIRNYLLTTLYNSFTSISNYYRSEVNHDLYG